MTRADSPFVLIDDSLSPGGASLLFEEPVEIVDCWEADAAPAALTRIAEARQHGFYAVGYLAYELGYLLEPKLAPLLPPRGDMPLLWMGLFPPPRTLDRAGVGRFLDSVDSGAGHGVNDLRPTLARDDYLAAIGRIRDYIAAGDVYQINFTFHHRLSVRGDPVSLYGALRRKQPVAHGALIRGPDWHVLSLSPELFVCVERGAAVARPMKGTAKRGQTPDEDAAIVRWLQQDEKSRAENLMIVDLLRNDLSRVALVGSVRVPHLFNVETYPTLHQMTSTVEARLRPGTGFREVIQGLFPCGSITGAPKVRAMEIIHELEPAPRGVYTGAIGMVAPTGDMRFNVAIRTMVVRHDGQAELGIGSGIVYDSDPAAEYEECLLKAQFVTDAEVPFQLIETMRWSAGEGYYLLDRHLARLAASARFFGWPCDIEAVRQELSRTAATLSGTQRVRLLADSSGAFTVSASLIAAPDSRADITFAVSDRPIDSHDPHRYHKTTRRQVLDHERERLAARTGCDEVLFVNERGELTEASYANVFIERRGRLLTPPLSAGLLDGTLRRDLIDSAGSHVEERILYPADLDDADAVWLGNSVRGLRRAIPVAGRQARLNPDPRPAQAGGAAGRQ